MQSNLEYYTIDHFEAPDKQILTDFVVEYAEGLKPYLEITSDKMFGASEIFENKRL